MRGKVVILRAPGNSVKAVPSAADLIDHVRQLATNSLNIRMDNPHLQSRLAQRGLGMRHVLETLRHGRAPRAPILDEYGDWRIKIERKVAGRKVQIVVAVKDDHFVVVTAI